MSPRIWHLVAGLTLYAVVCLGLVVSVLYEEHRGCEDSQFGCGVFFFAVLLSLPATVLALALVLWALPIREGMVRTGVGCVGGLLLGLPLALGTIGVVVALFAS